MDIAKQVAWMPHHVREAIVGLDFSMIDYQEDAYPYCFVHPADVSAEDDLTGLGRACRAYLLAHPEPRDEAYEAEAAEW